MSGVLWALVALAVTIFLFAVVLMLGLAGTAAHSDQVERGAVRRWVARKRSRRAA
jgi:hypothetical protein